MCVKESTCALCIFWYICIAVQWVNGIYMCACLEHSVERGFKSYTCIAGTDNVSLKIIAFLERELCCGPLPCNWLSSVSAYWATGHG